MTVEIVNEATEEFVEAVARLLPQLSRSATAPDADAIHAMLANPGMDQFVFRSTVDGSIVGLLSLITFSIPTGVRAWIEDVVVDEAARGQGAGRALVQASVARAHERGARSVDLTSRPSREAANRLYQACGFETRTTNVYRHSAD